MALKNSFQVIALCGTPRAGLVQFYQPFSSTEKLHFPARRGSSKPALSFNSSFIHPPGSGSGSRSRNVELVCKARKAVDEVQEVTESSWESLVLPGANPVLVEFWAPWCGPCKMIAPVIEELAREYSGKVACFKLNTDDSPNVATKYGIRSIPTVLFFKNGEKESVIGAVPKCTLSATNDKYIEN